MVSGFFSKIGEGLLLYIEEGTTVDDNYYMKILKQNLYGRRRFHEMTRVHYLTRWGSLPGSMFCYQVSQ